MIQFCPDHLSMEESSRDHSGPWAESSESYCEYAAKQTKEFNPRTTNKHKTKDIKTAG